MVFYNKLKFQIEILLFKISVNEESFVLNVSPAIIFLRSERQGFDEDSLPLHYKIYF